MKKLLPGEEIQAAIVQISDDTIFLDLNSKSEGVLNAAELKDENGNLSVKEGDIILVLGPEDIRTLGDELCPAE